MSNINKYMKGVFKSLSNTFRVAINKLTSPLIESARTISYVETISDKADTLHRHIKNNSQTQLKRAFELNTRKAIGRMGLGRVLIAFDTS